MKLNYDCVRDLLLVLECLLTLDQDLNYAEISLNAVVKNPQLTNYSKEDIAYTIYKLSEAGYIEAGRLHLKSKRDYYSVRSITYVGHEFLESVKPQKVWDKTIKICTKLGVFSLNVIKDVSIGVITSLLQSQL